MSTRSRGQTIEPKEIVYSAHQAVNLTNQFVRSRKDGVLGHIPFGTPDVNKYLNPFMAGDLVFICGRPQSGKTLLQQFFVHNTIKEIMRTTDDPLSQPKSAIFVTWEVPVEKATLYWLAIESGINVTSMMRNEVTVEYQDKYNVAVARVGAWPFYIVGHSIQRSRDGQRRRPNLTPDNVSRALDYLMNTRRLEPDLIAMDYLQRIHKPYPSLHRNEHLLQCVDWAKDTAYQAGCPVVMGTQAGRGVDEYPSPLKMPTLSDSEWTSNAEQTSDYFLSVTMPKAYNMKNTRINLGNGISVETSDRLLIMAVTKQKDGPAGRLFPLYVEPEYLKVGDWNFRI